MFMIKINRKLKELKQMAQTLEDQVAQIATDISAIKSELVDARAAIASLQVPDLTGIDTKLDAIIAQFQASLAPGDGTAGA